jgi:hypothetical protein
MAITLVADCTYTIDVKLCFTTRIEIWKYGEIFETQFIRSIATAIATTGLCERGKKAGKKLSRITL